MDPTLLWAALMGAGVALICTPAGISGAVFLLPLQVGVMGVPNPAATPTNLMFNLIATPAGLVRWWRTGGLDGALARRLAVAALPGVAVGGVLRVTVLAGRLAVTVMIGVVLTAIGMWLVAGRRPPESGPDPPAVRVGLVAAAAGIISGAYGMGGGSVIAPALVSMGMPARRVAPAALAATLTTSAAGVAVFELIAAGGWGHGVVGPEWSTGLALGVGGAAGAYGGARLQHRVPDARLRVALGVVATLAGLGHLLGAAGVVG